MKRYFAILLTLFLMIGLTACRSSDEQTEHAEFLADLTENSWTVDVPMVGLNGTLTFNQQDAGTLTLDTGESRTFEYSVSDESDNGKEANITITGTGISEVDGKTIKAAIVSDGLKLTYSGFSFILKPAN